MLIVPLLLAAATAADARWDVILACPRVSVAGSTDGTGVVIGTKDGFGYLLTAAHVVRDADRVTVAFSSSVRYPDTVWFPERAEVLDRWPDPDLALVRFPIGQRKVSVLPLAPAWQRPKTFPADARSVGINTWPEDAIRADVIEAKEFVAREGKESAFFWRTKVAPQAGRSGGALLDGRGRLIGITAAARGDKGYYTHHDEILAALKRSGHGWLVKKP